LNIEDLGFGEVDRDPAHPSSVELIHVPISLDYGGIYHGAGRGGATNKRSAEVASGSEHAGDENKMRLTRDIPNILPGL
jgi:hypothetical protein